MAKDQLVTLVVFQEMLEELVLPHCESVDVLEYFNTVCFGQTVTASSEKPLPYHDNLTVTTCTVFVQFTYNGKHKT